MNQQMRDAALKTKRIDTHGHLQGPVRPLSDYAIDPDTLDREGRAAVRKGTDNFLTK
ncbi:hypothetical protein ACFL01_01910 [Planctomycetota bacterium]